MQQSAYRSADTEVSQLLKPLQARAQLAYLFHDGIFRMFE
jgi:hypothetical protein